MTFFGCVNEKDGAHLNPAKASTVHSIPPPETPTKLQKFPGMVTYLSLFVPSLSSFTAPVYELHKKSTEFIWNQSHQEAFDTVCMDTAQSYFDVHKPVTI